jgi:hypothetical protein
MRYYNTLYNDIKDTLKNPDSVDSLPHFGPSRSPKGHTTSVSDNKDI